MNKVELLAPAGTLEALKIAVLYGANAVYIGGYKYGLRAKAKNFSMEEFKEGIDFAHANNVRVYVTANIIAHNEDFEGMGDYFQELEKLGVDALIVADPGVLMVAKNAVPSMEIHLSTQASTTNAHTMKFWYDQGVKRVVLARELSIDEITQIRNIIPEDMDIETFVHGAMCISYSGRCLLSNYMTNRDANRGACSQPCRWKYSLVEEKRPGEYQPVYEDERGTYIYNSKDMCMIHEVDKVIEAGSSSLKIEGRMKTPHYVASVVKAYREAIDDYYNDKKLFNSKREYYYAEASKASHRDYTTGFYFGNPEAEGQIYTSNSYIREYDFVAMVLDYDMETKIATIEQRNKFLVGEELDIMRHSGESFKQVVEYLADEDGVEVESAPHPKQVLKIKIDKEVQKYDIIRKKSNHKE